MPSDILYTYVRMLSIGDGRGVGGAGRAATVYPAITAVFSRAGV